MAGVLCAERARVDARETSNGRTRANVFLDMRDLTPKDCRASITALIVGTDCGVGQDAFCGLDQGLL